MGLTRRKARKNGLHWPVEKPRFKFTGRHPSGEYYIWRADNEAARHMAADMAEAGYQVIILPRRAPYPVERAEADALNSITRPGADPLGAAA